MVNHNSMDDINKKIIIDDNMTSISEIMNDINNLHIERIEVNEFKWMMTWTLCMSKEFDIQ